MGYIRGVIHGAVIGTALGLAIAPQEGARTREQVRATAEKVRAGLEGAQETARRVAPQVREAAETAAGAVASLQNRIRHREQDPAGIELSGAPTGVGIPVDGAPF
jgi:gas vesicle protein